MTPEQQAITDAYFQLLKELEAAYLHYIQESQEHPEDYEGVTKDDAYLWFIEGVN